jgi:peptide/nickel transport system permease protein
MKRGVPVEASALPKQQQPEQEKIRYYTASQWQLVWWRFRRNKLAAIGATGLFFFIFITIFADFLAPYGGVTLDIDALLSPPQTIRFCDDNVCSLSPFVYGTKNERDPVTLAPVTTEDPERRVYIQFFIQGETYKLWGLDFLQTNIHLFGTEDGFIHVFGTDRNGRDLFSRLMYGTRTSMTIGILGVLISFILGLAIGGVAGYFGGGVDFFVSRMIEFVRSVPTIPVVIALASAIPKLWTAEQVFFVTTLILGFFGWTTLARRVRGKLLSTRNEDFVLAARLSGSTSTRIIMRHLLPSFTSYIIVDLVVSFPYLILLETALSFVQVGLRPPAISWGILLQGEPIQKIILAPWLLILPLLFIFTAVLSFVLLGDGLRDAADPYS